MTEETTPKPTRPRRERDRARSSRSARAPLSLGGFLKLFLVMNILPILALGALAYLRLRGDIEEITLPEGATANFTVIGATLVALILVASLSLPAAHRLVGSISQAMTRRRAVLAGQGEGSRFLALLALPPLGVSYLLAWPLRLVLILLSFALIGVFCVFTIRIFQQDFLQEWVDRAMALIG